MSAGAYRCAAASLTRGDDLIGSATHVRPILLVEHPGPWGQTALRDAALPGNLLAALRRRASSTGVRILLCRRHRQRNRGPDGQDGVRVFAAWADPDRPWLETAVLPAHHDVLDLDLEALGAGLSLGLARQSEPVFAVCTHGRHDACCAERGRPVAAALSESHPDLAWEVSHLGGDRFAANLLVLGDGLGYGRLDPQSAPVVAQTHLAGRISPQHFRGRAGHPMPIQAAELAVRRARDDWDIGSLSLAGRPEHDGETWRVGFRTSDGSVHGVTVTRVLGEQGQRLTCSALRDNPVPSYRAGPVRILE